jgi:phenylacetic acid degradation operon negative regulatory protein
MTFGHTRREKERSVRARSALFELYGDHLRTRGAAAPVAAIVRLLEPLDIAAPAVRTAISRMVREGWLEPVQLPDGRGYALTPYGKSWLQDAAGRVYRSHPLPTWDGRWHIVTTGPVGHRSARQRLRSGMAFIGYAPLDESTWISPRIHRDVEGLLLAAGVSSESFHAEHRGDSARLVAQAWDLEAVAEAYERWRGTAGELVRSAGESPDDRTAYAVRCRLVHEWRLFLFRDPGLPRALLPATWPGDDAAAFFDEHSARLLPAASRYVDGCLPSRRQPAAFAPAPRRGDQEVPAV